MPRIFDNIDQSLLPELQQALGLSERADFCVGYFNLRGWKALDTFIDRWLGGDGHQCRLLVGMQRLPQDELRELLRVTTDEDGLDNRSVLSLKKRLAEEFRAQLAFGAPTDADEAGLRRLVAQLRAKKVVVKLFLRHALHAKLYLCFRPDPVNPAVGYVGSSNLTFAGLSQQGELNVDVMDRDATEKLAKWFEDRWTDRWCVDISAELIDVIEQSWAREEPFSPYEVYIKMAYHLAREARAGLSEFRIPPEFSDRLLDYQVAAVKIAAHHLNKRGGVLIGDVVGLGKTLMATAVAKIFQEDRHTETLIICPKNLVPMWENYVLEYRLYAKVLSLSRVTQELENLRRYRVVIIDESHNLRNREGRRYAAIQNYIKENESRCILLSATPYNKIYHDLSSQLGLFVASDEDLGVRPERLIKKLGETEFTRRHQCPVRSLAAFEKSEYADDWRELMRLYMVRRTRTFIQNNYAKVDGASARRYLELADGDRFYFPERVPRTVAFSIDEADPGDQYARLYAPDVVDSINALKLPRYGLGNYIAPTPHEPPTQVESKAIQDLSRAGKRLMGFCRTNLFKRLESSGQVFQQSLERHILRNFIFLHAIEHDLPLPIGTQDQGLLDSANYDEDVDEAAAPAELFEDDEKVVVPAADAIHGRSEAAFRERAAAIYEVYASSFRNRFKWLSPHLFVGQLERDLRADASNLMEVLSRCGEWRSEADAKLGALRRLLVEQHPNEKVIVFTQFADTVRYLERELRALDVRDVAGVTGQTDNPTEYAWRFSPESNNKRDRVPPDRELRVLLATDVLSEGQNLQDAAIVVNFDLPWAIIRLIQRAGRVDRIGQHAERILCYSFLPADGVERIIRLRSRVRTRLRENAEVVGTDEAFFEDESEERNLVDLYHEKAGILDGEGETEVDLASYAYQVWKNAVDRDKSLEKTIPALPAVVFATRAHEESENKPPGVLVYLRTGQGNDTLAWMDAAGNSVTGSQYEILRAAECAPSTPALPRQENHHALVRKAIQLVATEEASDGGQLGRPSGARFRTYERLRRYVEQVEGTLFDSPELARAIEEIYRFPLRQVAIDVLNRQLRAGIDDQGLAALVLSLREEGRLCIVQEQQRIHEPQIVCSLGLAAVSLPRSLETLTADA